MVVVDALALEYGEPKGAFDVLAAVFAPGDFQLGLLVVAQTARANFFSGVSLPRSYLTIHDCIARPIVWCAPALCIAPFFVGIR